MGQRFRFRQTGRVGYCRAASEVHENALSCERTFAPIAQCDVNGARCDECAFAEDELIAAILVQGRAIFIEMNPDDTVHHFALAGVNSRHVDGDRPGLDPELPMPANERCDLSGINDILAWQAGHIGTRSADILPIDDGGPLSFFGHRPGRQFAGCAAAQHEDIEFFGWIHVIYLWVAGLRREELLDESSGVVRVLFREEVAAFHRLSVCARSPLPPNAQRTAVFCVESVERTTLGP